MNQKIFNTVKISIATFLAIAIAELMHLEFSVSAGIVAILSIGATKKETIKTATDRFYAFILAIIIAYMSYNLVGYNLKGFCVYVFIFVMLCQYKEWHSAMAMNSVLISHFITFGVMDITSIANEMLLFLIGVTLGIAANMHLKKDSLYMDKMKKETEDLIEHTLRRMGQRILDKELKDYNGECFEVLNSSIKEAKETAKQNYMNQISSKDKGDMEYIAMRQKQVYLLSNMYKRVSDLRTTPITAEKIANYLNFVADNFNQEHKLELMLIKFNDLHAELKTTALPVKRKEFEDRAHLFILMHDMEEFLQIKKEYME